MSRSAGVWDGGMGGRSGGVGGGGERETTESEWGENVERRSEPGEEMT
jgi:hypothetical protein